MGRRASGRDSRKYYGQPDTQNMTQGRPQPQRQSHYQNGAGRQPEGLDFAKPINNEFKPLVKTSAQVQGRAA